MRDNYLMNIALGNGKNYSTSIADEEWEAFIKSADCMMKDINGFVVPAEVLEELWGNVLVPESVTIIRR